MGTRKTKISEQTGKLEISEWAVDMVSSPEVIWSLNSFQSISVFFLKAFYWLDEAYPH